MDFSPLRTRPIVLEDYRVVRSYVGGSLLDKWKGLPVKPESHLCEEWHLSVIETQLASSKPGEGLSLARLEDGSQATLRDIVASDPEGFLGREYVSKVGKTVSIGLRTGDSVVRLSLQAHPTQQDAMRYLNHPTGKAEAWYIVETREIDGQGPFVLAGFKEGVTKQQIREMFFAQDVPGIENAMHKLPIAKGDVLMIPAGMPHAMGFGAMFMEVADACDYTFKLERNMPGGPLEDVDMHYGIGFDRMLDCFDYTTYTREEIRSKVMRTPQPVQKTDTAQIYKLLDYQDTPRFTMFKYVIDGDYVLKSDGAYSAAIAIYGSGTLRAQDGYQAQFRQGQGVFLPADFGEITVSGQFTFLRCGGAQII
ncbi:MAG: class I mannose-6-phosphate isomerase [Christensenellales bacterium]|jgi:mannose-6-phosphate isomerase